MTSDMVDSFECAKKNELQQALLWGMEANDICDSYPLLHQHIQKIASQLGFF